MSVLAIMGSLSFRAVVALYPIATGFHVWEEWPGFPMWARRFASAGYSDREYVRVHVATVGLSLLTAAGLAFAPRPALVFGFFAFVFGPGVFWNAVFHIGATVWSRRYCPGAVTGALLYVPLAGWLARLAVRDGLLSAPLLGIALGVALAGHIAEVGHSVFKRW